MVVFRIISEFHSFANEMNDSAGTGLTQKTKESNTVSVSPTRKWTGPMPPISLWRIGPDFVKAKGLGAYL